MPLDRRPCRSSATSLSGHCAQLWKSARQITTDGDACYAAISSDAEKPNTLPVPRVPVLIFSLSLLPHRRRRAATPYLSGLNLTCRCGIPSNMPCHCKRRRHTTLIVEMSIWKGREHERQTKEMAGSCILSLCFPALNWLAYLALASWARQMCRDEDMQTIPDSCNPKSPPNRWQAPAFEGVLACSYACSENCSLRGRTRDKGSGFTTVLVHDCHGNPAALLLALSWPPNFIK